MLATGILGLLALVLSLSAGAAPVAREAGPDSVAVARPNSETPAFKRELVTHLRQYEQFVRRLESSPGARNVIDGKGTLPSASFARARQQVERLSLEQVAVLQRAYAAAPGRLTPPPEVLRRTPSFAVPGGPQCDPDPAVAHDWGTILIVRELAMAAMAAASSVPAPLSLPLWAVWAGFQGTTDILSYQQATQDGCEDDEVHQRVLSGAEDSRRTWNSVQLDLSPRVNFVAAFVNNTLEPWLGAVDVKLDSHTNLLNSAHTKLDVVTGSLGTSSTGTVHFKLDNLETALKTVSSKIDTLQTTVVAGQDLDLRLKIEADLSQANNLGIALFQVPQARGGYLELARAIVADTIAKQRAAGQLVGQAASFLASGDSAMAAHAYKTAYDWFGKAYRQAAN